jgi:hypothetical protein
MTKTQYFIYYPLPWKLLSWNLITHYHHNKLFTIKPEESSTETAKQEQEEKVRPAFRSSVSKQLQYVDIRGVSL